VIQAAAQEDPVALDIMEETASYLAMGVLMIFAAYDPQLLILAGGLAQAGDILLSPLRKAVAEQATGRTWAWEDRVALTALGDKAGALGAVALALQNVSPPPPPPPPGGGGRSVVPVLFRLFNPGVPEERRKHRWILRRPIAATYPRADQVKLESVAKFDRWDLFIPEIHDLLPLRVSCREIRDAIQFVSQRLNLR